MPNTSKQQEPAGASRIKRSSFRTKDADGFSETNMTGLMGFEEAGLTATGGTVVIPIRQTYYLIIAVGFRMSSIWSLVASHLLVVAGSGIADLHLIL